VLTSTGAGSPPAFEAAGGGLTWVAPVATTSGTAVTFTGIPAGTKRITVILNRVSTDGTGVFIITLGDSGGLETSNYIGDGCSAGSGVDKTWASAGGICWQYTGQAAQTYSATIILNLADSSTNTWTAMGLGNLEIYDIEVGSGIKALSGELTQLSLTTLGPDTFDGGAVNINYE